MKELRVFCLILLLAVLYQAAPALGKATTWTGAVSADWSEAGNWDCGGCPGDPFPEDGDAIIFDSNSAANLTMNNGLSLAGVNLVLTEPQGKVIINGNSLGLSSAGVEMSASTRDMQINAPLSLSAATTMAINSGSSLDLTTVSGAGGIAQSGGYLTLSGANTYSGATSIGGSGSLKLAVGATLASPAIRVNSGVIEFTRKNQLTGKPSLHLASGGVYYAPDYQTVGALTGQGTIRSSCGYYIVVDNDSDCEFSGDVEAKPYCGWFPASHEPNFIKQGSGTLTTSIGQIIGGTTGKRHFTVNQGRLRSRVTHFYASVHINSGASFHSLWTNQFLGDFNLNAGSFWDLYMLNSQISAPSDYIYCNGEINLAGDLRIASGPSGEPAYKPGEEIVFIYNETGNPVNGTFAGLPEGATINIKGRPYRISYIGGDGNDVSLTAPAAPGPSIISASTDTTGSYIDVQFDMAMDTAETGVGTIEYLKVYVDSVRVAGRTRAYQHNTLLRIFLDNPVSSGQVVTLGHEIDYRRHSPRDTGGALLAGFTDFPVTNNVGGAPPGPPALAGAATDLAGAIVEARFDKAMADPSGKHGQFSVTNGGAANACIAAALKPGGNTVIQLNLTNAVIHGQAVTLTYAPGDVQSADGQALAGFGPGPVTNNVPGGGGGGDDEQPTPPPEEPTPPLLNQGVSVCPGLYPDKVMLNWGAAVSQAKSYKVYRADSPVGEKTLLGRCNTTTYEDLTAEPGRRYYYWISQVVEGKESALSSYVVGWRYDKNPGRAGQYSGGASQGLLWWGSQGSLVRLWYLDGLDLSGQSPGSLYTGDDQRLLMAVADFDGDGISDLLWWDTVNLGLEIWLLNQTGPSAAETSDLSWLIKQAYAIAGVGHNQHLIKTGDFNGDGKADVLWRDLTNGNISIWLLDGSDVSAKATLAWGQDVQCAQEGSGGYNPLAIDPPQPEGSLSWEIQGVAGFTGDGRSQILWRNPRDGRLAVWILEDTIITGCGYLDINDWQGWEIKALADLNGDQRADILWRNRSSGALGAWLMDGSANAERLPLGAVEPALSWRIKDTGDFNGDGKADIYWRDQNSGTVRIWLMDGADVIGRASLGIASDF